MTDPVKPDLPKTQHPRKLKNRFHGYLPVVVDVETGGVNYRRDALLEIAAVTLEFNEAGELQRKETFSTHVKPFEGGNIEAEALKINNIQPFHPFRFAVDEDEALKEIYAPIEAQVKAEKCSRAVLVGHNATFDLTFMIEASKRCGIKHPFHKFTCLDTATMGGLAYGETVLARALKKSGIGFNKNEAHSAVYDAEVTADLFCMIINQWDQWKRMDKKAKLEQEKIQTESDPKTA